MKLSLLLLSTLPALAADILTLASPGGRVAFKLVTLEDGRLGYAATLGGKAVIEPSALGIVVDGVNLCQGATAGKPARYQVKQSYAWHGVHATATDRANGVKIPLKHAQTAFTLEARAYDDGIAFRLLVPGAPASAACRMRPPRFACPPEARSGITTSRGTTKACTRGKRSPK